MRLILFNSITLILFLLLVFFSHRSNQLDIATLWNVIIQFIEQKQCNSPFNFLININYINLDVFFSRFWPDASICIYVCMSVCILSSLSDMHNQITMNSPKNMIVWYDNEEEEEKNSQENCMTNRVSLNDWRLKCASFSKAPNILRMRSLISSAQFSLGEWLTVSERKT